MSIPYAQETPLHVCRDCYVGRCGACNGLALTFDEDDEPRYVRCQCRENGHES